MVKMRVIGMPTAVYAHWSYERKIQPRDPLNDPTHIDSIAETAVERVLVWKQTSDVLQALDLEVFWSFGNHFPTRTLVHRTTRVQAKPPTCRTP